MKKKVFALAVVFMVMTTHTHAGNGDLVVSGNLGIGTTGTQQGKVQISSGAVPLVLNESDQTGAVGYWRLPTDGGGFRIDQNTAAARDFSTYRTPFEIDASGNVRLGGYVAGAEPMVIGGSNGSVGVGMMPDADGTRLQVNSNIKVKASGYTSPLIYLHSTVQNGKGLTSA